MDKSLDALFQIRCGECNKASELEAWKQTRLGIHLPDDEFQCPACRIAFKRAPREGWHPGDMFIQIEPIESRL